MHVVKALGDCTRKNYWQEFNVLHENFKMGSIYQEALGAVGLHYHFSAYACTLTQVLGIFVQELEQHVLMQLLWHLLMPEFRCETLLFRAPLAT